MKTFKQWREQYLAEKAAATERSNMAKKPITDAAKNKDKTIQPTISYKQLKERTMQFKS